MFGHGSPTFGLFLFAALMGLITFMVSRLAKKMEQENKQKEEH